ncbi:MAG: IS66 family transposase [Oscillospiraceae bacterium]|jgi:transposase
MEAIRLSQSKRFGPSSEKRQLNEEELCEQLGFVFNEAEAYQPKEATKRETQVAGYTRTRRGGSVEEILPENVPVDIVEHHIPEEERSCPDCGSRMEEIGKEVRRRLVIIPAQVRVREDWYYTYACKRCTEEGVETPVVKAEKEKPVIPGSYATAEAIAHIAVQKFVMGSPLYRQEKEWNRQGIMLSRQTMSNWILYTVEDWLKPIYEALRRELVKRQVLHADETTLQVLREPGKAAQSKSYMWLYRTGGDTSRPIVLYEYQPDRRAEHPKEFLKGFSGYLHTDGYAGYHGLGKEVKVVGCWAHARRKFDEAIQCLPKDKQDTAAANVGLQYCNALFSLEKGFAELSAEERYAQRQKKAKPVVEALYAWCGGMNPPPKSGLGKALHYIREQRPYLERYLEDGRLEISNNRAERSIKPFVIDRKNFLFANTPHGAQGSAIIFSLIETAKENGLDPYRYLVHVLTQAPELFERETDWAQRLLPENAPESCRV